MLKEKAPNLLKEKPIRLVKVNFMKIINKIIELENHQHQQEKTIKIILNDIITKNF